MQMYSINSNNNFISNSNINRKETSGLILINMKMGMFPSEKDMLDCSLDSRLSRIVYRTYIFQTDTFTLRIV